MFKVTRTFESHSQSVSMNRNMTCSSSIEALYYRSTNFEPISEWCSKPLNEDLKKRLASKKETHSTVQSNCGEHGCLIRNAGGEDGWTDNEKTQAEIQAEA